MARINIKTLSYFLDDQLSPEKSEVVKEHLNECVQSSKHFQVLQEVEQAVQSQELPASFTEGVFESLSEFSFMNEPVIASAEKVFGNVSVRQVDTEEAIPLVSGMQLKKGDRIYTDKNSRALVRLEDGSQIYINQTSEIDLPGHRYSMGVSRGEIFAMMKPQVDIFSIKTPSAVLQVIGTEFAVQIDKRSQTALKVLTGEVAFENNKQKLVLKRKQQTSASMDAQPIIERWNNISESLAWMQNIDAGLSLKKGFAMKNILIAIVVLVVLFAGFQLWQGADQSNTPLDSSQPMGKTDNADVIELTNYYHQIGSSWRTQMETEQLIDNKWETYFTNQVHFKVIEHSNPKIHRLLMTIEKQVMRGQELPGMTQCYVDHNMETGKDRITTVDGKGLDIFQSSLFSMNMSALGYLGIYDGNDRLTPGQRWDEDVSFPFPRTPDAALSNLPESVVQVTNHYHYLGVKKYQGRNVAQVDATFEGSLGNLQVGEFSNGKAEVDIILDNVNYSGDISFYIDLITKRVIGFDMTSKSTDITLRSITHIPNMAPVEKTRTESDELVRMHIDLVYEDE